MKCRERSAYLDYKVSWCMLRERYRLLVYNINIPILVDGDRLNRFWERHDERLA